MSTLNVLDLFCGAGGLSYGFGSAGFNVLLGIDNDAKALETFELNHKGAKSICGDITQIEYEKDIKPLLGEKQIDVIIGGPPCQEMRFRRSCSGMWHMPCRNSFQEKIERVICLALLPKIRYNAEE